MTINAKLSRQAAVVKHFACGRWEQIPATKGLEIYTSRIQSKSFLDDLHNQIQRFENIVRKA